MKLKSSIKPQTEVFILIEQARLAEQRRDTSAMREILSEVWSDIDRDPEFEEYPPSIKAELYRLAGGFLTHHGYFSGRNDMQLRAKNLLTKAVNLFETVNLKEKTAEANIVLAFCYFNTGEWKDYNDLLELVELEFAEVPTHPICLQIKINRLLALDKQQKYLEAYRMAKQIAPAMALCSEIHLKPMFHTQAGIICMELDYLNESITHFEEALRFSIKIQNRRFEARVYNNMAFVYRKASDFISAHKILTKGINALKKLNDKGDLPHFLDTRALLFLDEKKPQEALDQVEKALKIFYKGEDFKGLADSLWTKCKCLFELRRNVEAHFVYLELQRVAFEKIGEVAVNKYVTAFDALFHPVLSLDIETEQFEIRKKVIHRVLKKSRANLKNAAKILGFSKPQSLSRILREEMPELYDDPVMIEAGLKRGISRGKKQSVNIKNKGNKVSTHSFPEYPLFLRKNQNEESTQKTKSIKVDHIKYEKPILIQEIPKSDINLPEGFPLEQVEYLFFKDADLDILGLTVPSFVAVADTQNIKKNDLLLFNLPSGELHASRITDESIPGLGNFKTVKTKSNDILELHEVEIIGVVIGFLPDYEAQNQTLNFYPFQTDQESGLVY